jgi:hypothetical protein
MAELLLLLASLEQQVLLVFHWSSCVDQETDDIK